MIKIIVLISQYKKQTWRNWPNILEIWTQINAKYIDLHTQEIDQLLSYAKRPIEAVAVSSNDNFVITTGHVWAIKQTKAHIESTTDKCTSAQKLPLTNLNRCHYRPDAINADSLETKKMCVCAKNLIATVLSVYQNEFVCMTRCDRTRYYEKNSLDEISSKLIMQTRVSSSIAEESDIS